MGERWLTRKQAMSVLGCGHNKLRQLHLNNVLAFKYEGDKPHYDAFSLQTYLISKKVDPNEADKEILATKFFK